MPIPETQFSIYKIDFDLMEDKFNIQVPRTSENYIETITNALINSIVAILKKKSACYHRINNKGFIGVVFKTVHKPAWKEVALQLLGNEEARKIPEDFLTNTNVSYVFTCHIDNKLYVCTGGYGSNYVSKFVVKNFGLYLLPKMIDSNNQVIKNVIQNNLIGNQTSTNKVNRSSTSVSNEQDMSSIFRQLTMEANRTIAESLGIVFEEEESINKKTNIINKDSLVIRRNFSLDELMIILKKVSSLENKKDAFALNYMVLARKKGIKNADLYSKLIKDFSAGDFSKFVLVGDDYEQYYLNASKYTIISTEDGAVLLDKNEPITITDLAELVKNKDGKITKTAVIRMLKQWEISTEDNNGNALLYPVPIYDAIQGFIEYGEENVPCYLFNSNWYVFDKQYEAILNQEYKTFFDINSKYALELKNKWKLKNNSPTENAYNESLAKRNDLIVSHKALLGNIEIADVIFWDSDTVYLMHNKKDFDGAGARDLTNQILSAAEYFQIRRMSLDRTVFFKEYYAKIKQTAKMEKRLLAFTEKQFVDAMENAKHICFIAGYLCNYRKDSNATYAKYLSVELKKKLNTKGMDCYLMGLE